MKQVIVLIMSFLLWTSAARGDETNDLIVQIEFDRQLDIILDRTPHLLRIPENNSGKRESEEEPATVIVRETNVLDELSSLKSKLSVSRDLNGGARLDYGFKLKKKELLYLEYTFP